MELDIEMINELEMDLSEFEALFNEIALYTFDYLKIEEDIEFSVSIIDNDRIHEINREYRHIDRPTDVITFALEDEESPYVEGMPRLLGDIFISYDKAVEQSQDYGHSIKRELCFLFTHGLLHLLGYDHMVEEDEKVMMALQDTILNNMDILRK
ncbi:rRNA maturation RNase YbeY [Beduini massiliensis]|uniref:rRNA maturation RNase YbeY n=1 Tax=Beduini massiliensis TaxID=1585974 RepID=UPI00059A8F80|nr:rRNA maturation RNase YbeY [Beduini massiliensis]